MPAQDTKITALAAIGANPINVATFPIPMVDLLDNSMAASGTTKKVTVNQILGAGGTATLASATITGGLTVDTSTLVVNASTDRVGIGTASPNVRMELSVADAAEGARLTASSAWLRLFPYLDATDKTKIQAVNGTNTALSDLTLEGLGLRFNTNAGLSYAISNTSIHTWQNVGGIGGTAMTLNANGLGVGVAPSVAGQNIYVKKDQAAYTSIIVQNDNTLASGTGCGFTLNDGGVNAGWFRRQRDGSGNTDIGYKDSLRFRGDITGTERTDMTIDATGNVISNVTGTAPTLATNSQMVFNLTSNTNLRISVRGSDGVTRVANITIA